MPDADRDSRRPPPTRERAARDLAARAVTARAVAAVAAVGTVAAGLAVRAGADGVFAKYAGSALYTVLLCALVAFCAPRARPLVVAATALGLSWAVEFAQLTGVPAELSAHSAAARLILGSTFNAPDLLWYAVGAAGAWAVLRAATRARG
ncbi:ribosomal maturation YjgA family protein [Streptomyces sp. NPDC002533]